MSVASLTKFTIPVGSAANTGMLMPKMKYRFRVTFTKFGNENDTTTLSKQVKTFKRPNPKFESIVLDVYNSKVNVLGKTSWDDVTCVVRDDATGVVAKLIGQQLQKQFDYAEQSSAASGGDYKFTTVLEILDGGNGSHEAVVLDQWEMYGCMILSVEYGDMDYSSNDAVEISFTIKFDNALQNPLIRGVGGDVGRTLGNIATG